MFKKIFMLMVTIFIIGLLFSCQSLNRYPDKEGVLLRNGSFENGFGRPVGWWKMTSQNRAEWSKNQSYTAERSIAIKSFKAKDEFSFWAQTIKADSILGEKPILKVFIKTEDLIGKGAAIAIRCDKTITPKGNSEIFYSSEGKNRIIGNTDWVEYSIKLNAMITDDIKSVTIYLILLRETSGTVYFDEISLSY